jgi:small-conductance mechanosensitive channel
MAAEGPEEGPPRLDWKLEEVQLELETAQAIHDLQKITVQNLTTQIQIAALQVDISQQDIEWVRKNLHLDKADQEKQLETLERNRSKLQQRRKELIREQTRAEAAWLEAQKKVENAKKEEDITLATAALAASEARREASQRLLEQTEDMVQLLNHQEESWKRRYALLEGEVDAQQLDAWWKELEAGKKNIERGLRFQETSQIRLQSQITALEKQLADQTTEARLRRELESRLSALRALADDSLDYLGTLLATGLIQQRLLDEIAAKRKHLDLRDELEKLGSKVRNIWNFELWVIDGHGVTVRKLVVALVILIIGLLFIRSVILFTAKRLLPRTHLKTTTAAAVEKMINYAAILLIVLFALRIVNIPLTVFAFLGGAIAIGLGFGAQNLINNFISGFIIMAEQPIKIGDLIEIEGAFAMVEEIGARCTRIRTGANVHILVPNSSFLEKNIINWTLSDKMVRAQITAGVIYGSPVREVERFMLQAAAEHSRVLKRPEPFVLFNDFGDNALIFELYFWISMNRLMEQRIIESDLRFHVDALFREAGIVIAFPQRDVHLDTQRPLELRIVDAESRSDEEEG